MLSWKRWKKGALIIIANSFENFHKERRTTKLKKMKELKEMKNGASIAIINSLKKN
jgi:hypothetical protein